MTDNQLSRMNIRIARKLGWHSFKRETLPPPLKGRRMAAIPPEDGHWKRKFIPGFTNNLAYALKLVEHANKKGYDFVLQRNSAGGAKYYAYFNKRFEIKRFEGYSGLSPLAICLAFLKIK